MTVIKKIVKECPMLALHKNINEGLLLNKTHLLKRFMIIFASFRPGCIIVTKTRRFKIK